MLACEIAIDAELLTKALVQISSKKEVVGECSLRILHDQLDLMEENTVMLHESKLTEALTRTFPEPRDIPHLAKTLRQTLFALCAGIACTQARKDMARTVLAMWRVVLCERRTSGDTP